MRYLAGPDVHGRLDLVTIPKAIDKPERGERKKPTRQTGPLVPGVAEARAGQR